MKRLVSYLAMGMIAMLVLAACGGDDDDNGNGDGNGNGGNGTSIQMDMDSFFFDPESFSASAGDEVTVELDNVDTVVHDFVIDEWDVEVEVEPEGSGTANFTVPDDASGDYVYYCSIPGHRESGMEGTLTVE